MPSTARIAQMRERVNERMNCDVKITRRGEATLSPTTLALTHSEGDVIYEGRAMVRRERIPEQKNDGGRPYTMSRYAMRVPIGAVVLLADQVTIVQTDDSDTDADLIGVRFQVTDVDFRSTRACQQIRMDTVI